MKKTNKKICHVPPTASLMYGRPLNYYEFKPAAFSFEIKKEIIFTIKVSTLFATTIFNYKRFLD